MYVFVHAYALCTYAFTQIHTHTCTHSSPTNLPLDPPLRSIVPNKLSLSRMHARALSLLPPRPRHEHVSLHTAHMHMHSALAQILAVRVNPPPEHCLCSPSVAASGACGVMMRQLLTQTQISAARQRPKCNCQNCRCSRSLQSC